MNNKEKRYSIKNLSKENKKIIHKIEHYLETHYVNDVSCEEIISDIIGMALECQERGDSFSKMIGEDHETFCRELIKNTPRQHLYERILGIFHWFLLFAMILLPGLYFIELLFAKYSPAVVSGLNYSVRLTFLLKYYIIMFVVVIGWFFVRMYTYKPTKYVFTSYFAIIMLFFLFTDGVLSFLIDDHFVTINVLLWIIIFGALLIICDLISRITAMTIAYKRKDKQGVNND